MFNDVVCRLRFLPMLLKVNPSSPSQYPLGEVMKLLASPLCKLSVGSLIMNMVENVLEFRTSTSTEVVVMETGDGQLVPVGQVVDVDDSGRIFMLHFKFDFRFQICQLENI